MNKHQLLIWYLDTFVQHIKSDRPTIERINKLIKSIFNNGYSKGLGNPEHLKYFSNSIIYSRRINKKDRLVYAVKSSNEIVILSDRYHY